MASRTNQPFPGLAHAERRSQPARDAGAPWVEGNARTLALAAASGAVFGFLLQKGGVAKFDILLGVLLLENFVVAKVMLTAIVVGMIGFHLLAKRGAVEAQIKPVAYGSNLIGGLVFGAGFALMAYCPGTDAAAVGQGNLDALVGMVGLVFGSYLFALASRSSPKDLTALKQRGELTLPELLHVRRDVFVAVAVPVCVVILALLEVYGP